MMPAAGFRPARRLALAICCALCGAAGALRSRRGDRQSAEQPNLYRAEAGSIHGWGWPTWFGSNFDESPANLNPFAGDSSDRLSHLVGNQFPTAPLDRMDRAWAGSASGDVPMAPGGIKESYRSPMENDYLNKYTHPMLFPGERRLNDGMDLGSYPVIPLEDKEIIASHDTLRSPIFQGGDTSVPRPFRYDPNPLDNYPLVAPGDRLAGGAYPAAHLDEIPERVARFIHQVRDKSIRYKTISHQNKDFHNVDNDNDTMISHEEYVGELVGRQNKTELEAKRLWDRFHTGDGKHMSKEEFERLERTGFSVGSLRRVDVSSVLDPAPESVAMGFWGSGAECPENTYVTGARLKIQPSSLHHDNSALNRVGLRCSDGSEANSIEGPDGEWTRWADCPRGQRVYGIRVRSHILSSGRDHSGINGVEFVCRATSMSDFTRLRFGDGLMEREGVVVAAGPVAKGGGWSQEKRCGLNEAVCGLQANVDGASPQGDEKGIVDLRVYCCHAPVVCTDVCAGDLAQTVKCLVCKQARAQSKTMGLHIAPPNHFAEPTND